jgi:AcrR family transcriptional regulator
MQWREGAKMPRISKPPEIRRQEILDTAMRVFYEKGYEATSMADIAKELNVVQGLCYRYFPSKQELFKIAMEEYVKECCEPFLRIIHDQSRKMEERMNAMSLIMKNEENNNRYHDFYHKSGNEAMHEQLTLAMCKYMIPHVCQEFTELCEKGEIAIENVEITTEFIMYGQISLWQSQDGLFEDRIRQVRKFISAILGLAK